LWLLRDYRDDWPDWPNGMGATEPPVCLRCARYSVRACPELRKGWVAVRVGHSVVAGVYGVRYQAATPRPVVVDDVTVAFGDPAIRWTVAGQLVREIRECVVVDLDTEQ
jgi:hypothetical protein